MRSLTRPFTLESMIGPYAVATASVAPNAMAMIESMSLGASRPLGVGQDSPAIGLDHVDCALIGRLPLSKTSTGLG